METFGLIVGLLVLGIFSLPLFQYMVVVPILVVIAIVYFCGQSLYAYDFWRRVIKLFALVFMAGRPDFVAMLWVSLLVVCAAILTGTGNVWWGVVVSGTALLAWCWGAAANVQERLSRGEAVDVGIYDRKDFECIFGRSGSARVSREEQQLIVTKQIIRSADWLQKLYDRFIRLSAELDRLDFKTDPAHYRSRALLVLSVGEAMGVEARSFERSVKVARYFSFEVPKLELNKLEAAA